MLRGPELPRSLPRRSYVAGTVGPDAGAWGGARACSPWCVRVGSITGASRDGRNNIERAAAVGVARGSISKRLEQLGASARRGTAAFHQQRLRAGTGSSPPPSKRSLGASLRIVNGRLL